MGRPCVIVHEASVRTAPKDSADYPFPGERIDGALRQVIAWSTPSSHIFPLFLCSNALLQPCPLLVLYQIKVDVD